MTNTSPILALNPAARIGIRHIGNEQQPVFVVDDAMTDAQALVDFAASSVFGPPAESSLYPGLNAHLPPEYLPLLIAAVQQPLVQLFRMVPAVKPRAFGFFGLSTVAPEQMMSRQALPHTDSTNLNSFATVHFLTTGFGGTAFYRHKSTGFEVVSNVRSHDFEAARHREIAEAEAGGPALATLYEEIAYIEPAFNRLILYRATQLHSARIDNSDALSNDPRTGRLTINGFFNA